MICLLIVQRSSEWLHVLSSGEVTCPTRVCRLSAGLGRRWYIPNVHTWPATCRYADLRPTVPSHSPHPNQQKALWKKVLNYSIPEDSIREMKSGWSVSLSTIWGNYQRIWGNRDLFYLVKNLFQVSNASHSSFVILCCFSFKEKNKLWAFLSSEKVIIWITNGNLRLCLSLYFCLCLWKRCWWCLIVCIYHCLSLW